MEHIGQTEENSTYVNKTNYKEGIKNTGLSITHASDNSLMCGTAEVYKGPPRPSEEI